MLSIDERWAALSSELPPSQRERAVTSALATLVHATALAPPHHEDLCDAAYRRALANSAASCAPATADSPGPGAPMGSRAGWINAQDVPLSPLDADGQDTPGRRTSRSVDPVTGLLTGCPAADTRGTYTRLHGPQQRQKPTASQYRRGLLGKPFAAAITKPPAQHSQSRTSAAKRSSLAVAPAQAAASAQRGASQKRPQQSAARPAKCNLCQGKSGGEVMAGEKMCGACQVLCYEGRQAGATKLALRQALRQGFDGAIERALNLRLAAAAKKAALSQATAARRLQGSINRAEREDDVLTEEQRASALTISCASCKSICTTLNGSELCKDCEARRSCVQEAGCTVQELREALKNGEVLGIVPVDALKVGLSSMLVGKGSRCSFGSPMRRPGLTHVRKCAM